MIDNLTISFEREDIAHTLNVPTRDENLPYNLATAFAEIIKQSDVNDEMVIDNLGEKFSYYKEDPWISVNDRLPAMDEEVIALNYDGRIFFAHIVDPNIAIHYNGWNVPSVLYWMPFKNPLKD